MWFYSKSDKSFIIFFMLTFFLCYILFLLFIENRNLYKLKKVFDSFDIDKLKFEKNLDDINLNYYDRNPYYLSENWYFNNKK
jgi:hypothetical protein